MSANQYTHLLIDVDDTLYPASAGIWPLVTQRMYTYMHEILGFNQEDIPALRRRLFKTYGTTLRGLQTEYSVDFHDFLAYVHDIKHKEILQSSPQLYDALASLPHEKWLFTNASRLHGLQCAEALGVLELFKGVVGIEDTNPFCKPQPEAFARGLERVGVPPARNCIFVDDRPENLDGAASLGMRTVLVAPQPVAGYDQISELAQLPQLIAAW